MPANADAKNVKIEVHLLQNFAPSCLNRDETNTPKDCEFGGYRRARISSQCFKRAVRQKFRDEGTVPVGERTKRIKQVLADRLRDEAGVDEETLSEALNAFIEAYYSKRDSKRQDETAVLLYVSDAEVEEAAKIVTELLAAGALRDLAAQRLDAAAKLKADAKAKVKIDPLATDAKLEARLRAAQLSADIALFGRMLAENPEKNVDAACQVAHSLSTHAVDLEMDFYTAVDDLNPKADTGAGMLGVTGYNSACFYRYALLDRAQLVRNLGGDADLADRVIEAFLTAFTRAIPKARQNGMAAHNPPSFGLYVVRDGSGTPVSLANAFADPVASDKLKDRSVAALAYYWTRMNEVYGAEGVASTALFFDGEIEDVSPLVRYGKRQPAVASFLDGADKGSAAAAVAATMDAVRKAAGA